MEYRKRWRQCWTRVACTCDGYGDSWRSPMLAEDDPVSMIHGRDGHGSVSPQETICAGTQRTAVFDALRPKRKKALSLVA